MQTREQIEAKLSECKERLKTGRAEYASFDRDEETSLMDYVAALSWVLEVESTEVGYGWR